MRSVLKRISILLGILLLLGAFASCASDGASDVYDDGTGNVPESETWSDVSESNSEEEETEPEGPYRERVLLVTDFHHCHQEWYGVKSEDRMEAMVRDINAEYRKDPFSMIVFMGDYSLDHWKWQVQGSWIAQGVSYTKLFIDEYKELLPDVPMFWLAGNHEQFGEENWMNITGNSRQGYEVIEDYLLIFWDSYGGELDPDYHHDGVYTPMDTEWVKSLMDEYADKKVILISHHFSAAQEEASQEILKDDRVICLFAGHNHNSSVSNLGKNFGYKYLVFAGNYSYFGSGTSPEPHPWGFRDLVLTEDRVTSTYIVPRNTIYVDGEAVTIAARTQNEAVFSVD